MERFWFVMRDVEQSFVGKRHPTLNAAKAQAERLCEKENIRFLVLEFTCYVEPRKPVLDWYASVGSTEIT